MQQGNFLNEDPERAILGVYMRDVRQLKASRLEPEHFLLQRHRLLFEILKAEQFPDPEAEAFHVVELPEEAFEAVGDPRRWFWDVWARMERGRER